MKSIKTLLLGAMCLFSAYAYANANDDLWKALKSANDKDALAAIAAGADVNNLDAASTAPISLAACFSGQEVVKALIDGKANINYVQPSNGYTPLMNAASWGNTEAIKLLLAAGADIKPKDKFGRTILSMAVSCVQLDVIKILVEAGADPAEKFKAFGQDQSVLMSLIAAYPPAEKVSNLATTRINVEKGGLAFPDRLKNAKESDFTPLGEIAAYLISKGADPNHKNGGWGCILNQAIEFKKVDIAKALVTGKADLTVTMRVKGKVSGFDGTALMLASLHGYTDLVELLVSSGADINFTSREQTSYVTGDATVIIYHTVRKKNNALSLALDYEHADIAEILKKNGAKEPK